MAKNKLLTEIKLRKIRKAMDCIHDAVDKLKVLPEGEDRGLVFDLIVSEKSIIDKMMKIERDYEEELGITT